jgi:hypothetical protein
MYLRAIEPLTLQPIALIGPVDDIGICNSYST